MVIQIYQKTGDLGEGSTHTTSDWNEEMEEDKEEENVQAPEPQGLVDEGEQIPRIVEDMEKEDQDAQIMEQCGDKIGGIHCLVLQYLETSLILYSTIQNLILF